MYMSNNLGGYGGLGSAWGNAAGKAEAANNAAASADALIKKVTTDPVAELKSELPPSISEDNVQPGAVRDPQDFIPKPKKIVGAFQAMQILTRPKGLRGGQPKKTKGRVYWTATGPKFSENTVQGGETAERVPPPVIKLRPNVKVVRDLPALKNLEPLQAPSPLQGFGDTKSLGWGTIAVLGLLSLMIFGYNSR